MARTRFGPEDEDYYDPRWTPTVAEKAARGLFLERLYAIAPRVGENLRETCLEPFRAVCDPTILGYSNLWSPGPGWVVIASAESEIAERAARVQAGRREKARRNVDLRRALLGWRRRWNLREREPVRDPWLLNSAVEKLCWLDVHLIEARPDAITYEVDHELKFYSVPSFWILISLYEKEGYLHEALDVAERASHYGQAVEDRDRLVTRIAAVENEERE